MEGGVVLVVIFNFEPIKCPIGKFTPLKDPLEMFLLLCNLGGFEQSALTL